MTLFNFTIPIWVLDWSGSGLVVVSLGYLFGKRVAYWHWSNASLVPYFALFVSGRQFMLAGLQASYLIFGVHGLALWYLERQRDRESGNFNERAWYNAGWILSLAIFCYTLTITDLIDGWAWLQLSIVSLSLIANWATTRKWAWSWPVWMTVNVAQSIYFRHLGLTGQFLLQFVLFAMSAYGWTVWRKTAATPAEQVGARVSV
jgi:nicotinamide mononucleotide transporter